MDKSIKGNAKADAKAEHKTEEIRYKWKGKTVLDVLIYICGALVAAGGLWLGYLGVSGHLRSHQSLGLWILFGTLLFVMTGGFLYFQKGIWDGQTASPVKPYDRPRPYITTTGLLLQNLAIGQKPRVDIEYTASGQIPAYQVQVSSRIVLTDIAQFNPDYSDLTIMKVEPYIAPGTKIASTVFASWDVNQLRLEEINSDKRWIYAYGVISYQDEAGQNFPPYYYCFKYDTRTGAFAFYSPPKNADEIKDSVVPMLEPEKPPADRPRIIVTKILLGDVAVNSYPRYEVRIKNVSPTKAALKVRAATYIMLDSLQLPENPTYPILTSPQEITELSPKEERRPKLVADFTLTASDIGALSRNSFGFTFMESWTTKMTRAIPTRLGFALGMTQTLGEWLSVASTTVPHRNVKQRII